MKDFRETAIRLESEIGQSTIEAAFVAPLLMGCVLLLAQPCIVLYDRIIMQSAAAEACRLSSTLSSSQDELVDGFVHRRLAAIPQQDCFHVHQGDDCSYTVEVNGDQTSETVEVSVGNKLKPLPLIDFLSRAVGATDQDGCWDVNVSVSMPTQPTWAYSSPSGSDPDDWVGDWL